MSGTTTPTHPAFEAPRSKAGVVRWWTGANFAVGAGFSALVALLIPPYVTEVTSDVAACVAMVAISLAAVLGPALARFADAHALVIGRRRASGSERASATDTSSDLTNAATEGE